MSRTTATEKGVICLLFSQSIESVRIFAAVVSFSLIALLQFSWISPALHQQLYHSESCNHGALFKRLAVHSGDGVSPALPRTLYTLQPRQSEFHPDCSLAQTIRSKELATARPLPLAPFQYRCGGQRLLFSSQVALTPPIKLPSIRAPPITRRLPA